mmetsp:Transcript_54604/g.130279  ORF Transcript_54604/g.130279 Transcript_54604/m.130279 type:complete len:613 (+) Transcript_54604:136-1974(+)
MAVVFPAGHMAPDFRSNRNHANAGLTLPMLAPPSSESRSRPSKAGVASEGMSSFTMGRRQPPTQGSAAARRMAAASSVPALSRELSRGGSGTSIDSHGQGGDSDQPGSTKQPQQNSPGGVRSASLSQFRKPTPNRSKTFNHQDGMRTRLKKSLSNMGGLVSTQSANFGAISSRASTRSAFTGMLSRSTAHSTNFDHTLSSTLATSDGATSTASLMRFREAPESYRMPHEPDVLPSDLDEDNEDADDEATPQSKDSSEAAPYEAPVRTTRRLDRTDVLPGGFKFEDDVRTLIKGHETDMLAGYKFGSRGHIVGMVRVKPHRGDEELNELLPEQPEDPATSSEGELRYKISLNDGTTRLLSEFQICHPGIFRLVQMQRLPGGFTYGDEVQLLETSLLTQAKEVVTSPGLGAEGMVVGPAAREGYLSVHFKDDSRTWSLRPRMLARSGEEFKTASKSTLPGDFERKEEVVKVQANADIGEELEDQNADIPPGTRGQVLGPGTVKGELLVLFRGLDRRSMPPTFLVKAPPEEERKGSKQSLSRRLLHPSITRSREVSSREISPDVSSRSPDRSSGSEVATGSQGLRPPPSPSSKRGSAKARVLSPWRLCKALLERA